MTAAHVGEALCQLLMTQSAQSFWRPFVRRRGRQSPHREAVSSAIAKQTLGDERQARRIKDRICDALNGTRVSAETLDEFAETFLFSPGAREMLGQLLAADGSEAERLLRLVTQQDLGTRPYRTVQLHEVHMLGPNGWPRQHTTVQTIEAMTDKLDTIYYSYIPGEDAADVEVTLGGTATATRAADHPHHDGLVTTTIKLSRVLSTGDPHELTYVTRFQYTHQPEQVFRRGLSPQVEVISIKVIFDQQRLPARVWEMEWNGDDGREVTSQRRVRLAASEHSVQLLRRRSTAQWIGYAWDW